MRIKSSINNHAEFILQIHAIRVHGVSVGTRGDDIVKSRRFIPINCLPTTQQYNIQCLCEEFSNFVPRGTNRLSTLPRTVHDRRGF